MQRAYVGLVVLLSSISVLCLLVTRTSGGEREPRRMLAIFPQQNLFTVRQNAFGTDEFSRGPVLRAINPAVEAWYLSKLEAAARKPRQEREAVLTVPSNGRELVDQAVKPTNRPQRIENHQVSTASRKTIYVRQRAAAHHVLPIATGT